MPKTVAQDLREWAAIDENGTRADDLRRIADVCDAQTAALEACREAIGPEENAVAQLGVYGRGLPAKIEAAIAKAGA